MASARHSIGEALRGVGEGHHHNGRRDDGDQGAPVNPERESKISAPARSTGLDFLDLPADMLVEVLAARPETHVPLKLTCKRLLKLARRPRAWPYSWIRSDAGYRPLEHQHAAMKWAISREARGIGGILVGGIGHGKTLVMLACMAAYPRRTLIVAPIPLIKVWRDELTRAIPGRPFLLFTPNYGTRTPSVRKLREHDLVVTSYTMLAANRTALRDAGFGRIVFDEAHRCRGGQRKLVEDMPRDCVVWALTGTPTQRDGRAIRILKWSTKGSNAHHIEPTAAPDVGVETHEILVPPHPDHLAVDADITAFLSDLGQASGEERRWMIWRYGGKGDRPIDHYGRRVAHVAQPSLEALAKLVAAAPPEDMFVVFCGDWLLKEHRAWFAAHPDFIVANARESHCRHLDIERFEAAARGRDREKTPENAGESTPRALVLSYSITEGFNLQFANSVVFLTPPISERDREQAIGRVRRIGQTRRVHVHHIIHTGTIEERMMRDPTGYPEWQKCIRGPRWRDLA